MRDLQKSYIHYTVGPGLLSDRRRDGDRDLGVDTNEDIAHHQDPMRGLTTKGVIGRCVMYVGTSES
jgi:hypothetical protein